MKEGINMAIRFKGKLKNDNLLELADISHYHKIKRNFLDYFFTFCILLFLLYCGLRLLIGPYKGPVSNILFGDIIGLIIVVLLMIIHEYLHAMQFSKNQNVTIWYKGFMMMTYCTEEKNPKSYIKLLLLPNIIIALPIAILTIYLYYTCTQLLFIKVFGLCSCIIILGTINDLSYAIYLIRKIKYFLKSGGKSRA